MSENFQVYTGDEINAAEAAGALVILSQSNSKSPDSPIIYSKQAKAIKQDFEHYKNYVHQYYNFQMKKKCDEHYDKVHAYFNDKLKEKMSEIKEKVRSEIGRLINLERHEAHVFAEVKERNIQEDIIMKIKEKQQQDELKVVERIEGIISNFKTQIEELESENKILKGKLEEKEEDIRKLLKLESRQPSIILVPATKSLKLRAPFRASKRSLVSKQINYN